MRKRRLSTIQIVSILFAGMLIFSFVVSLVITPSLNNPDVGDVDDLEPFPTLTPTTISFPTPEPSGPNLTLQPPTLQQNGLFQVAVPEGWLISNNQYLPSDNRARISFNATERLSVIDAMVDMGINFPSLQALSDDYLTPDYFAAEWARYQNVQEVNRTVGDDRLTLDFNLTSGELNYLGRQISWLNGDWMQTLRLVVPENYPALLDALASQMLPTFTAFTDQQETPPSWVSYPDQEQGYLIRTPSWQRISRAVLQAPNLDARARLRSIAGNPLASLDAAEAFVTAQLHTSADIQSAQVTERENASGYLVSYTDTDVDGNPVSGLVVLLNDAKDGLYIADIEVSEPDLDLLSLEANSLYHTLRQVADSFMLLPDVPVIDGATPEATAEASDDPTPTPTN